MRLTTLGVACLALLACDRPELSSALVEEEPEPVLPTLPRQTEQPAEPQKFRPELPVEPRLPRRSWPPLQASLPSYQLLIAQADLDTLDRLIDQRDTEVPGKFAYQGRSWEIRVRYRGRHTRYLPKKSFQVKFPDADLFDGVRQLELLAEWKDGGVLTEKLWYDLFAAAGVRAPRASYVNLELNGKYYGVFTEIQAVKKEFLRSRGFFEDSDIYRCGMYDCELRELPQQPWMQPWEKRTNESQPWDHLFAFLALVNRTPQGQFRAALEGALDVESYLRFMAVDELIAMTSTGDSRSFLVHDRREGRWSYVPWDLNNAISIYNRLNGLRQSTKHTRPLKDFTPWDPRVYALADERSYEPGMTPTWSTLSTRVLEDEELRSRLVAVLRELLSTSFRLEELGPRIDQTRALIAPDLSRDPFIDQAYAERSADFLKRYVANRQSWMLENLEALARHNDSRLKLDRVGLDVTGAPFVQIYNPTSARQSLSGLYLTFDLRRPRQWAAPSLSVPPGAWVTLRPPLALSPDRPEVALFDSSGTSPLDLLYPGALSAGQAYGRSPRGAESYFPFTGP